MSPVLALLGWLACTPREADVPDDSVDTSVDDLVRGIRDRRWTAASITADHLARIEATNRRGPTLNAVLAVNDQATAEAAARDAATRRSGTLFGVPVLLKDNIDVEGLPTTAG
ncbi:MAG: amidase family protein, partial [Myxococcota bacterium]